MNEISEQGRRRCNHAICDNGRIYTSGWPARVSTLEGMALTYPWIEAKRLIQVDMDVDEDKRMPRAVESAGSRPLPEDLLQRQQILVERAKELQQCFGDPLVPSSGFRSINSHSFGTCVGHRNRGPLERCDCWHGARVTRDVSQPVC